MEFYVKSFNEIQVQIYVVLVFLLMLNIFHIFF